MDKIGPVGADVRVGLEDVHDLEVSHGEGLGRAYALEDLARLCDGCAPGICLWAARVRVERY